MKTHEQIDERSYEMARRIVEIIDGDPRHAGFEKARSVCARWQQGPENAAAREWAAILRMPWKSVREILLDKGEHGSRLRQSSPFCGILPARQRWEIYRKYSMT